MNRRFLDLTVAQQDRISLEVGRMIGTLQTDSISSIVRFAIDAYMDVVGDDLILDAVDTARSEEQERGCPECEERRGYIAEAIETLRAAG